MIQGHKIKEKGQPVLLNFSFNFKFFIHLTVILVQNSVIVSY